jgi:DNA-binding Lrp family transcriptional regulator
MIVDFTFTIGVLALGGSSFACSLFFSHITLNPRQGTCPSKSRQTLKGEQDIDWRSEVIWMPMAYILISTEEFDVQLMNALRKIKGVEESYPLYGVYDIIVKTRADTMDGIKEIHNKIRRLEKIRQTLTMIAHEE